VDKAAVTERDMQLLAEIGMLKGSEQKEI